MKTTAFLALSALLGLTNAAPVNKREIVLQTVTSEVVETVVLTTTVWVDPPSATGSSNEGGEFFESAVTPAAIPQSSAIPESSSTPAPPSSSSTPEPIPSSTPAPAPPAPSTTEAPPAPAPTSEAPAPAPPAETSAPAPAPAPEPSSAPAPAPAPEPSTPAPAPETPPSGGSGEYTGDLTHYTPGLGSCGITNGESDWIVAVSAMMFDPHTPNGNPNKNDLCNKGIKIYFGGKSFDATITDRCAGCAQMGDLDMPQAMFDAVTGGTGDGRVKSGMTWGFA